MGQNCTIVILNNTKNLNQNLYEMSNLLHNHNQILQIFFSQK